MHEMLEPQTDWRCDYQAGSSAAAPSTEQEEKIGELRDAVRVLHRQLVEAKGLTSPASRMGNAELPSSRSSRAQQEQLEAARLEKEELGQRLTEMERGLEHAYKKYDDMKAKSLQLLQDRKEIADQLKVCLFSSTYLVTNVTTHANILVDM